MENKTTTFTKTRLYVAHVHTSTQGSYL